MQTTRLERRQLQDQQRSLKQLRQMTKRCCDIVLVRHGETDWNVEGRLQGQLSPGPALNERGVAQAEALAKRFCLEPEFDAVYGSDLLRVRQTIMEVLRYMPAPNPPTVYCPELRERHLGNLQGCSLAEAEQRHPHAYAALTSRKNNDAIEGGGESVNALCTRVAGQLELIAARHPAQRVLVVTHGGCVQSAYQRATGGMPLPGRTVNCALNAVRIDASTQPVRWGVVRWADLTHLEDDAGYSKAAFGGGNSG